MNHFYHQLNQSHRNLHQEDYIHKTSSLMKDALNHKAMFNTILIIGAGNLSDIPLDYFCEKFHEIYLTDIDQESMNQALVEKQQSKIKVIQMDYLGLDDVYFNHAFFNALIHKSKEQIEYDVLQEIDHILDHHFSKKLMTKFDVIYISPIYTQLLYRACEYKLDTMIPYGLSPSRKDDILSCILQQMANLLHHFNQVIMNLLNPEGIIFVASDIFLLTDNDFSLNVKKHISNQKWMNDTYQAYLSQYGIGLGDFGLADLAEHFQSAMKTWLLWGIQTHQSYAVQFCVLK